MGMCKRQLPDEVGNSSDATVVLLVIKVSRWRRRLRKEKIVYDLRQVLTVVNRLARMVEIKFPFLSLEGSP